jgi:hypothetical protein
LFRVSVTPPQSLKEIDVAQFTNETAISLDLAVWLLHDEYDYIDEENYISVTGLMKPTRQIILTSRIPAADRVMDVGDFTASALGKAIHDSIEKAWIKFPEHKLKRLGYSDDVIARIKVNPTLEEVRASNDIIPVYIEQRAIREHKGYKIGGKFDMVTDGIVKDNKSTSAFAWTGGTRDEEHILQLSLYRWIDAAQEHRKITEDFGMINYIFTDWSKMMARQNPKYPQKRIEEKRLNLMSLQETEQWVDERLAAYEKWQNSPEKQIPHCTDAELWRSAPQFKYYSNPAKTDGRSTKNFDNLLAANAHLRTQGKGVVITKPGEVKRCGYCPAFEACSQKDAYL